METLKPPLKITRAEWRAKEQRGLVAVVDDRQFIVAMHESTHEPVYVPVAVLESFGR